MEKTNIARSIKELYGYPESQKKKEKTPKNKYYKMGEKIAREAIKKVEKKEKSRSLFEEWNV